MTRRWSSLAVLAGAAILFTHISSAEAGRYGGPARAPLSQRILRGAAAIGVAALCVGCAVQNRTIYTQHPTTGATVVVEEHQVFLGGMMNWAVRGGLIEARPVYTPHDYGRVSGLYRRHLEDRRWELSNRRFLSRAERQELVNISMELRRLNMAERSWLLR